MKRLFTTLLVGGVLLSSSIAAQDGTNQVSYLNLAQQFSTNNVNGDPGSLILPSVALGNGYGSYIDNPASVALLNQSHFNFGYLGNFTNSDSDYLGTSSSLENQRGRLSNMGILYSYPTVQGSFVLGGGYNLTSTVSRDNLLSVQNMNSSITDAFADPFSQYNSIAFETFAIDYLYTDSDELGSIFRVGFAPGEFNGIYQDAEVTQRTRMGEFSLFGAAEVAKNLFAGASFSVVAGSYSYERSFLEQDITNLYSGDFIVFGDGSPGTDIRSIETYDEIDADIVGTTIRTGLVYKLSSNLNIGASYVLPTRLFINETYYSYIETVFDDNSFAFDFFESAAGDPFDYEIRKPGQLNLGVAIDDLRGLSLSGAVEFIDYRDTEVILTSDEDLSFTEISNLRVEEGIIDSTINADYNFVANLKFGGKYRFENNLEVRTGFQVLPGKSSVFSSDKFIISGGFGFPVYEEIYVDITTQYAQWDDRSIVYEYNDTVSGALVSESISESFSELNLLIGLRFNF
ncbi:MAG: hypothetical protein MI700_03295 [Balneolales bacterium]|nr:hypothetical protein [Balneolales bacterium]